jgi:PleD family two-component response regulator
MNSQRAQARILSFKKLIFFLSSVPSESNDSEKLTLFADRAFYRPKKEGRNRIHLHNAAETAK